MLETYLKNVEKILNTFEMDTHDKKAYIQKLHQQINEKKHAGLSEEAILADLKEPRIIRQELSIDYIQKMRIPYINHLLKLIPLVLLIIYLATGFITGLWHPAWLIFLLWPVLVVLLESINDYDIHPLTSVSPLIILTAFLTLGVVFELWHPGWSLLFLMPFFPLLNSKKAFQKPYLFYALIFPTILIPSFFFLQFFLGQTTPYWALLGLSFLPLTLTASTKRHYLAFVLFILGIAVYMSLNLVLDTQMGLFALLSLPLSLFIAQPNQANYPNLYRPTTMGLCLLSGALYISLGLFLEGFLWAFVVFMLPWLWIQILRGNLKDKPVSIIATLLSVSLLAYLGGFLGHFAWAWLVLLLIPVTRIIEDIYVKKT